MRNLEHALIWDQFRYSNERYTTIQPLPLRDVTCTQQFCHLHKHVLQISYYTQISAKNQEDMCHLFSKAVNMRCQGRKFPIIFLRMLQKNKTTNRTMQGLLLLSLLGNYDHVKRRTTGMTRRKLYDWFFSQPNDFYFILVKFCDELVMNTLREFVLFSIHSHPWLEKHLTPLMSLEGFEHIVVSAMDRVREYFDLFLCEPAAALYHCQTNEQAQRRVIWDLNERVHGCHSAILDITYRRPNMKPCEFIASTRKRFPLVKMPTQEEIDAITLGEETEEQFTERIMREMEQIGDEDCFDRAAVDSDDDDDLEQDEYKQVLNMVRLGKNLKKTECKTYDSLEMWRYVKQEVYEGLKLVVQNQKGGIDHCLHWLLEFGVSEEVLDYTRVILKHYYNGTVSAKKLKERFVKLQRCEPYAYTLIQLLAGLVKQRERQCKLIQLPLHYVQNQLLALQKRFPVMEQERIVLDLSLSLVFCKVCDTDYSLIRVFPNPHTGKKVYTQYYRHGFRDAVVDYETNELYCKRNRCNVKGRCPDQPLQQVPILGQAMLKNGKCILICPLCGLKMELDLAQTWYSPLGVACADCTKQHRENPRELARLQALYPVEQKRNCFKCFAQLKTATEVHLLPADGVYLCKHCSKPWIVEQVENEFPNKTDKQTLEQFLVKAWAESKLRFKHSNEERHKRNLQQYKKQQGNKRVRR